MTQPETDTAPKRRGGLFAWLKARLLPEMPDFYAMLVGQCAVTAKGTSALARFLEDGDAAKGREVRSLEHEGDRIKAASMETLHRSFATPMDREDFYDAIVAIDEILNYAKTSVREMEMLELSPDPQMAEMAGLIDRGAQALLSGFQFLEHDPKTAGSLAEKARKTERSIEKVYRRSLAALFDPVLQFDRLRSLDDGSVGIDALDQRSADTLNIVTQMMKRREIYRHLSNAADHVANAAQVLEDIVAKAS
jgi:uncharacterized protein Yka (UPF0111/DUF47 family)